MDVKGIIPKTGFCLLVAGSWVMAVSPGGYFFTEIRAYCL
jgi:hypothetical protein